MEHNITNTSPRPTAASCVSAPTILVHQLTHRSKILVAVFLVIGDSEGGCVCLPAARLAPRGAAGPAAARAPVIGVNGSTQPPTPPLHQQPRVGVCRLAAGMYEAWTGLCCGLSVVCTSDVGFLLVSWHWVARATGGRGWGSTERPPITLISRPADHRAAHLHVRRLVA